MVIEIEGTKYRQYQTAKKGVTVFVKEERKEGTPFVVTTNAQKGGVSKTSITLNGAYYLDEKHDKSVLVIDCDPSCNATNRLLSDKDIDIETTVYDLFSGKKVTPIQITKNISLIAGSRRLRELKAKDNKDLGDLTLFDFFDVNSELMNYDFILIDTHNDNEIFTRNAIAFSDRVVNPIDCDEDSFGKIAEESQLIDNVHEKNAVRRTRTSQCSAELVTIGSRLNFSRNNDKEFVKALEDVKDKINYLGYIQEREAFAKIKTENVPITQLEKKYRSKSDKAYFKRVYKLFDDIFMV